MYDCVVLCFVVLGIIMSFLLYSTHFPHMCLVLFCVVVWVVVWLCMWFCGSVSGCASVVVWVCVYVCDLLCGSVYGCVSSCRGL